MKHLLYIRQGDKRSTWYGRMSLGFRVWQFYNIGPAFSWFYNSEKIVALHLLICKMGIIRVSITSNNCKYEKVTCARTLPCASSQMMHKQKIFIFPSQILGCNEDPVPEVKQVYKQEGGGGSRNTYYNMKCRCHSKSIYKISTEQGQA